MVCNHHRLASLGFYNRSKAEQRSCQIKTFRIFCNLGTFYAKPRDNNSSFSRTHICHRIALCKKTMLFAQLTSQNATFQCPTICITTSLHWTKLHKRRLHTRHQHLKRTLFPASMSNQPFVCSATDSMSKFPSNNNRLLCGL